MPQFAQISLVGPRRVAVMVAFSLIVAIAATIGMPAARAGQIMTDQAPVATLADGRAGTIAFEALTPKGSRDFVARQVAQKSVIAGVLTLPEDAQKPGAAKVPAMVVVHGSSGVLANEWEWAKRMNEQGYASFVIDNFTGRGIAETATDQSQLSTMADVAGALAALKLLATHPAIDAKRIGVIGFSRGGSVAIDSVFEPIRRAVIDDDLRFAVHVPVYVGCSVGYMSAHLDGSPILMLLGGKDDYTPAAPCVAYADVLRAKGASIKVVVYPNAYHGFDGMAKVKLDPRRTTVRNCHGSIDLDTGGVFTMLKDGQPVTGEVAVAELKRCTERGVMLGGDPEAREKAPLDVAAFLKSAFGAAN